MQHVQAASSEAGEQDAQVRWETLRSLLASQAMHVGQQVTLSTGKQSNYYFDCKPVTLSAAGASLVADAFLDVLNSFHEPVSAVGGLTHGADPIIGAMMMRACERGQQLDGFYVRKEPKRHGTKRLIENPPRPNTPVLIVDDVVTTGSSVLRAIDAATEAGCNVVGVVTLIDRDEGGTEEIRRAAPNYVALYTRKDFPEINEAKGNGPPAKSEQHSVRAPV